MDTLNSTLNSQYMSITNEIELIKSHIHTNNKSLNLMTKNIQAATKLINDILEKINSQSIRCERICNQIGSEYYEINKRINEKITDF